MGTTAAVLLEIALHCTGVRTPRGSSIQCMIVGYRLAQDMTSPGPILKARLLHSRKSGGTERGGVGTAFRRESFPKSYV